MHYTLPCTYNANYESTYYRRISLRDLQKGPLEFPHRHNFHNGTHSQMCQNLKNIILIVTLDTATDYIPIACRVAIGAYLSFVNAWKLIKYLTN